MQGSGKIVSILLAGLLGLGLLAVQAPAALAEGYLKIDGIKGESVDDKHQGWIDIMAASWDETVYETTRSGDYFERPKRGRGEVTITKRVDSSSRPLQRNRRKERKLDLVVLQLPAPDEGFLTFELQDVTVTDVTAGAPGTEIVTLRYRSVIYRAPRARRKPKIERDSD